ncbi:MAG: SMC family ATPase [Clostridiales bacterium]|nr:SMC family ATPase [Clostridiales bacterium]
MKPLTLYMRNFKSYGENTPIFDFGSFDIVLLTGNNGNGKSSIADAISWCIWGKCKGTTGRGGMDDLVRTGANDMEVELRFEEDGNIYRVLRKRDKKRSRSSLELYIESSNQSTFIGGSTISETQSKIESLIRLDYETYLCTAYLSQGKADMFAAKSPNERKEILAEILNLSSYDDLAELARVKRRKIWDNINLIGQEIDGLKDRIEDKDQVIMELGNINEEMADVRRRGQDIQKSIDEKTKLHRDKRDSLNRLKDRKSFLKDLDVEIKKLQSESTDLEAKQIKYSELVKNERKIIRDYDRANKLRAEYDVLREQREIRANILNKMQTLQNKIEIARHNVEHKVELLNQKIDIENKKLIKEETLLLQRQRVEERFAGLELLSIKVSNMEKKLSQCKEKSIELRARTQNIQNLIDELRERYKDLLDADANCPTCKRVLSERGKRDLLGNLEAEALDLKESLKWAKQRVKALNDERVELEENIDRDGRALKDIGKMETKLALINKELAEIDIAKQNISALNQQLEPLKESIEKKEYEGDFIQKLSNLKQRLDEISYDQDAYERILNDLKGLKNIDGNYHEVQIAKAKYASNEHGLKRLQIQMEEAFKRRQATLVEIRDLQSKADGIEDIEREIVSLRNKKKTIETITGELQSKKGALDERLRQIRESQTTLRNKEQSLTKLNEELFLYDTLIEIYGKRGIQAAIIENAIPELQDETNRILNKITDGNLTVEFSTQRDTKSGSIVETLDIKISDGMETRKYETYSGGEEFRINFGIRIALSKILARRAGATVRMLILDEGFGTLDESGRERLAQIINAISDEFEKIIVITHIEGLKEYFSNQIEIYKTDSGSMFKPL